MQTPGIFTVRTKSEKRDIVRFRYELHVINEECGTGVHFNARMYNYSLHGMYIESDLSLFSGMRVNVWLSDLAGSSLPEIRFAEVRWCEEIIAAVVLYNYGAGIRYHQPITFREFPRSFQVIQGGLKDAVQPKK
jgi:hypothetical protein